MHDADQLNLRVRLAGDSPIAVGHAPGQPMLDPNAIGTSVILRKGDESVLVDNVQRQPNGKFAGMIAGFEPSFQLEFEGLRIEEDIVFRHEHVISHSGPPAPASSGE